MKVTGITFNFSKTVRHVEETENPTPEQPVDTGKEKKPKVAGENSKKSKSKEKEGLGDAFVYDMIKTAVKTTISAVIQNVSGSPTLQVQLNGVSSAAMKGISYIMAASTNPALFAGMLITDTIQYGFQQAGYSRSVAWSDYDLEQYRELRGYSKKRSRE